MSKNLYLVVLLVMSGALLASCEQEQVMVDPTPADVSDPEPIDVGDQPYRPRRRMDIEQLDQSIQRVTGGLEWVSNGRNGFERFSEMLGVADYVGRTVEDRSVSVLFLKFLDDASRNVCERLMNQEFAEDAEEHVFLVHASAEDRLPEASERIEENLRYLLLRYHGRHVPAGSAELRPWSETLQTVAVDSVADDEGDAEPDYRAGWESVCVSLMNHPDFFTY